VLLPARDEASTIGEITAVLRRLRDVDAIDDVLVVDDGSTDETADIAARSGARVMGCAALLSEHGPGLGKGDAVWRGLSATTADIVCVLDADLDGFEERFVHALLFDQPLSGQWAARRELLVRLPFWTGYALEICLLLDAVEHAGIDAVTESYLGTLLNRHQSLGELGDMATAVLHGVLAREHLRGGTIVPASRSSVMRRPPLVSVAGYDVA